MSLQAKLLRALDRGEFYRVEGRDLVRLDLYYWVAEVDAPPLKEL